jgi:predicted permease
VRGVLGDARYALRQLRQSPASTIAAVASLAIGMTALTATFSGVNAIMFRPMPGIAEQGRLLGISAIQPHARYRSSGARPADFEHVRRTLTAFSDIAAWRRVRVAVEIGGEPRAVRAERVTANYFSVLGTPVPVALHRHTSEPMAVVSHGFAVRNFGTPAAAIGAAVRVDSVPMRIAAVTSPGFAGTSAGEFGESERDRTQLWLPLDDGAGGHDDASLLMFGRLTPSATLARARAEAAAAPPSPTGALPVVNPLSLNRPNDSPREIATAFALLFGVPVIVLAVGCANAANLLLARAARRRTEMAVRLSLGATRARIVRQLLVESVLIAAFAGVLGVVGTMVVLAAMAAFLPIPVPVDARVAMFALAATFVTGVLFGLAPALAVTRDDPIGSLRDSGAGITSRSRLRGGLVVAQMALSLVLLVIAGLFMRTLQHRHDIDDGRNLVHVAVVTLDLTLADYSAAAGAALQRALMDRAERIPGVTSAAVASMEPFGGSWGLGYRPADQPAVRERYARDGSALGRFVETAGLIVIAGRNFADDDRRGPPATALVSAALAQRTWPGEEPLGQRLLVRLYDGDPTHVTVIGVTRNLQEPVESAEPEAIFLPSPLEFDPTFSLWVRTTGDPARLVPHLHQIVRDLDPRLPLLESGPAEAWRYRRLGPIRWIAAVLGGLGVVALLLATGGMYAVTTYLVAARRHELGVRSALGARPGDLVRLVGGEAMRLALAGLAVGLLLALPSALLARAELVGISPFDPVAFSAVAGLLTIVALAASASPARRAARVDPMTVLRRT